jgi:signal transduction histidine kinase
MIWRLWKAYLFPGGAENDPGFRQEIQRIARTGLRVAGWVGIGTAVFFYFGRFLIDTETETLLLRSVETGAVVALGVAALAAARWEIAARRGRTIGIVYALFMSSLLFWFSILISQQAPSFADSIPGQATVIMLVGVAAFPLRPMQAFFLGSVLSAIYVSLSWLIEKAFYLGSGPLMVNLLFIEMLTLLCTGLAALVYRERYVSYRNYQQSLRAAEELREVEARMMLAEQSATLGRLAAAMSHEMNSPIGALKSAVDTLLLLASRQATAPPAEQPRLVRLQSELRKTVQESTGRLSLMVSRIQRFANLDNTGIREADLNELLGSAVELTRSTLPPRARLITDYDELPRLLCRPEQLSAVFHGVLTNAIEAIKRDGEAGLIRVKSQRNGPDVDIIVEDNGRGIAANELSLLFEPHFQVTGNRVASGNWGMFSFRRMVREHGGDITVQSDEGRGTRVNIHLPCSSCFSSGAETTEY